MHHNPLTVLKEIHGYMPLKNPNDSDPDIYLSAKLKETQLPNGIWAWGMSPSKYVNQAIKNTKTQPLNQFNGCYRLPTKADNPFPTNYKPELDVLDPLDLILSSFYLHLIGMMQWMIELGCIDVAIKILLLLSHLAFPRLGHLLTALHVMANLKQKNNSRLVFNLTYPAIDLSMFP
jgi:hypothetical protein